MKPFKNISLVERLEASIYNNVSSKGKESGPGGADTPNPPTITQVPELKLTAPSKGLSVVDLKKIPDFRKRNDELIKLIRNTSPKQSIPIISTFAAKSLTSFVLPTINTTFAQTMKLEDRLGQSIAVKSTSNLPAFFLSDSYTDYITITKFGVFNHISNTPISTFNFIPNRRGTDILPTTFEAITLQGTRLSNNQVTSIITTQQPFQDIIIRQGTFFANGVYVSQPTIISPISEDITLIRQGTVYSNGLYATKVKLTTPAADIKQGASKSPLSKATSLVNLLQGLVVDNLGNLKSTIKLVNPVEITQKSIILPAYNNDPKAKETQEISKSEYQGDKALSILLPRIKHGSADLANTDFGTRIPFQGLSGSESSIILPIKDFTNKSIAVIDPISGGVTNGTLIEAQGLGYFSGNRPATDDFPGIAELSNNLRGFSSGLGWFDYKKVGTRQGKPPEGNVSVSGRTGIIKRTGNYKDTGAQRSPQYDDAGDTGFTKLIIASYKGTGYTLTFPALLTALSDSWSPSWTDQNFIGRQDTFKNFKGVTRSVSLGFKVVAWRDKSAEGMWAKLNKLIAATSVGTPSEQYTKGPIIKLTVGGLFKGVVCVCTSLKIDTNPAEYAWDIDTGHPMIADISMDVTMLVSNNGELLNAKTNNYYG